jgi:hypothetical protein
MFSFNQKTYSHIESARLKIVAQFLHHCREGQQTKSLGNPNLAACGQFISNGATQIEQRGLHGCAAALRVLNQATDPRDSRDLIQRIVNYLADRARAEPRRPENGAEDVNEKNQVDDDNTIKVAELLYSIADIPLTIETVAELKRGYIERLKQSIIEGRGWAYFMDAASPTPELLPTAYAVMGLSRAGEDVSKAVNYLLAELERKETRTGGAQGAGADITVRVACLYAVCFQKAGVSDEVEQQLRRLFDPIWRKLEPLLNADIEQNIEYWRRQETFYVRVPWQLYLLALAARLRFYTCFGSVAAQRRLMAIVSSINGEGFRYPHSGSMVSSRTNAIALDVLGLIREAWRPQRGIGITLFYAYDTLRHVLGSRYLRLPVRLCAAVFFLWAIYQWANHGTLAEVGPELIAASIMVMLMGSDRK